MSPQETPPSAGAERSPPSSSSPRGRARACARRRRRSCTPSAAAACSATCWPPPSRSAPAPRSSSSGPGATPVEEHLAAVAPAALPVVQEEQRGSGHAAAVALAAVPDVDGPVLAGQRRRPAAAHRDASPGSSARTSPPAHALTVLTAEVAEPTGLGRIVRDGAGAVVAIVEERDATDEQRAIREINAGVYVGDAAHAAPHAGPDLGAANDQGEQYVTDVLGCSRPRARRSAAFRRRRPRRRPRLQRPARAGRTPPDAQRPRPRRADALRRHRRRPADHLGGRDGRDRAGRRPPAGHPDAGRQHDRDRRGRRPGHHAARHARWGRAPPSSGRTATWR